MRSLKSEFDGEELLKLWKTFIGREKRGHTFFLLKQDYLMEFIYEL